MEKDTETTALENERNRLRKELLQMIVRNEQRRREEREPLPQTFPTIALQASPS